MALKVLSGELGEGDIAVVDAADGEILLTQKRIGTNIFEYRATRRRRDYGSAKSKAPNENLVLA